jgi:GT2 family glycosyltransferase
MTPTISIFIVNYNTCTLLEQCLRSIFGTEGDLNIEVFVADNNSTDGSPEMVMARFPRVSLVTYSQNVGYTSAINSLLPLAKGEYYLLLHPDVEILTNTFGRFVAFFERHPQAGILGANLYYPDGTPNPCEIFFPGFNNDLLCFALRLLKKVPGGGTLVGHHNPLEWSHESTSQVNWVWNACMMVRREIFETVGYFDEDFFVWYADWDLCKRVADAGWSVYYLHPATAIHHERKSFVKECIISDETRYKVDGWYSAHRQIKDRHVFLKKHSGPASIYGIKTIHMVENALRLMLILANLMLQKSAFKEASFQLRACLQTIQAILKA